jgi:hypothetical protein
MSHSYTWSTETQASKRSDTTTTTTTTGKEVDDFDLYLKKCVQQKRIRTKEMAQKLGTKDWVDLAPHEKALAALMWGFDQPEYRDMAVDPRTLFQVAFQTVKRPSVNRVRNDIRHFSDRKFDDFYQKLLRQANKAFFEMGGILLKERTFEEIRSKDAKGAPISSASHFVLFRFSKDQNARYTEAVIPSKVALGKAAERYALKHGSVKKGGLNAENRAQWEADGKLVGMLSAPRTVALFAPPENLIKNGVLSDPAPRKGRD